MKHDFFTIKGLGQSAFAEIMNPDGNVKVEGSFAVTGFTDSIAASLIDSGGVQYSGTNPLPVVFGASATQGVMLVDSDAVAYSGTNPIPVVFGASATQAVVLVDSTGVAYGGDNPLDVDGTVVVSGITNSVAVSLVDSGGVGYSGSNRVPTRPINARGSLATAYVSLTTGTETTLLAGIAGEYRDLIYVMGSNNSDVAATVDIRDVTGGNIQTSIRIPANGTAGVSMSVPLPQSETGNNWTADLPDITGTTVTLSALFSKEV